MRDVLNRSNVVKLQVGLVTCNYRSVSKFGGGELLILTTPPTRVPPIVLILVLKELTLIYP